MTRVSLASRSAAGISRGSSGAARGNASPLTPGRWLRPRKTLPNRWCDWEDACGPAQVRNWREGKRGFERLLRVAMRPARLSGLCPEEGARTGWSRLEKDRQPGERIADFSKFGVS